MSAPRPAVFVVIDLEQGRVAAHLVADSLDEQRLARRLLERHDPSEEAAAAVTALISTLKAGTKTA